MGEPRPFLCGCMEEGCVLPLRLGELFLESIRILERRVFPCVAARSRGFTPVPHQGLTPPLHPRQGHLPLDPLFRFRVTCLYLEVLYVYDP